MSSTPVIDLKFIQPIRHLFRDTRKEMTNVLRQTNIFSSHGLHAHAHIPTLCYSLSRKPQCQKLQLPRPLLMYGLCSTNISGKPSRYRSLPSLTAEKVIPHGYSRHHSSIKSCRCQRAAGLAYICRSCPFINYYSTIALQQRTIRNRSATNRICSGCYYHRPVSLDVSMGYLSPDQGSHQITYTSRPERQHPYVYPYFRRNHARCKYPRYTSYRTGGILRNGPRVPGLYQTPRHIRSIRFLFDSRKIQFQIPKNLFSSDRPLNRSSMRSDYYADRILFTQKIPKQTTTHKILRYRNQQNYGLSYQQFLASSTHYHSVISLPMAGRTLFQMDQATSTNKEFLWHFSERRQNSNLDRCISIHPGHHTQKTTQYISKSLHDSTNIERYGFRKNPAVTATYRNNIGRGNLGFPKPVEFIHLTVGH